MSKLTENQLKSLSKLKMSIDRLLEANKDVDEKCWQYSNYSEEYQEELWDNLEFNKEFVVSKLKDVLKGLEG